MRHAQRNEVFTVDIIGDPFAQPGDKCVFRAIVTSGGTAPFTHVWGGLAEGETGQWAHAFMLEHGWVFLTSTDASMVEATASFFVDVDESNMNCTI